MLCNISSKAQAFWNMQSLTTLYTCKPTSLAYETSEQSPLNVHDSYLALSIFVPYGGLLC